MFALGAWTLIAVVAIEIPGGKRNLNMNINIQQVILNAYSTCHTIQVYIKFYLACMHLKLLTRH